MENELWNTSGRGTWQYIHRGTTGWNLDEALIRVQPPNQWELYINRKYIATFDSWEAARDATPMMIALHGIKSNHD